MRRQLQVGLVNVANARGRAMRDEWADPVCISVAQRVRTERMDMYRHRPRHIMEGWLGEWPGQIRIVPAVIQRAVRYGITLWTNPADRTLIHHWDSNFS